MMPLSSGIGGKLTRHRNQVPASKVTAVSGMAISGKSEIKLHTSRTAGFSKSHLAYIRYTSGSSFSSFGSGGCSLVFQLFIFILCHTRYIFAGASFFSPLVFFILDPPAIPCIPL